MKTVKSTSTNTEECVQNISIIIFLIHQIHVHVEKVYKDTYLYIVIIQFCLFPLL